MIIIIPAIIVGESLTSFVGVGVLADVVQALDVTEKGVLFRFLTFLSLSPKYPPADRFPFPGVYQASYKINYNLLNCVK